jgi:hypothetical protein
MVAPCKPFCNSCFASLFGTTGKEEEWELYENQTLGDLCVKKEKL